MVGQEAGGEGAWTNNACKSCAHFSVLTFSGMGVFWEQMKNFLIDPS